MTLTFDIRADGLEGEVFTRIDKKSCHSLYVDCVLFPVLTSLSVRVSESYARRSHTGRLNK